MPAPTLSRTGPDDPEAVVLMLHGGKSAGHEVVDERSLSWRRSAAMRAAVGHRMHRAGAATWLLRYRHRGWNGGSGPVEDARWALEEVRRLAGEVPVVLLGHSMGARTSVHVADDPLVRGVVALAPWFPQGEAVHALAGKHLRAAHGSRDRITSARATAAYVERASGLAASARFRDMGPVGHYLLRGVLAWNEYAVRESLALLAD